MVKAFTTAAPHLRMMAPPPVLWQSSLPYCVQRHGVFSKDVLLTVRSRGTRTMHSKSNDQFIIKPVSPPPSMVPRMVMAVEDKPFSDDEEESLSDTSSCKDSVSMVGHGNPGRASPTLSVKLTLPVGKPLRAKPRLVKCYDFTKNHFKAPVPLKSAIVKKKSVFQRSDLSQDEKLFVEAAATLAQSAATTAPLSNV